MDTFTQALLGGAVGYAVAGKTSPRKAVLWSAAIAILPDLDVFISYANDLAAVTHHRSWTHSWFVQTLIAPFLAFILKRRDASFSFKSWWLLIWFALITHSALDALTVYGTQLFWPLMPSPYSGGSVFIIDPVYSIPLLIGFFAILFKPKLMAARRTMNIAFSFSCCYLLWGLIAQNWVGYNVKLQLAEQNIVSDKVLVTATPLNTLLWRILIIDNDVYYEGFRSVFDNATPITFSKHQRNTILIDKLNHTDALQRLSWFTNGFYSVNRSENSYIATDLRMGLEPVYFFRYEIAKANNQDINEVPPMQIRSERNTKQGLTWTWQRIWDPEVQFNKVSTGTNS